MGRRAVLSLKIVISFSFLYLRVFFRVFLSISERLIRGIIIDYCDMIRKLHLQSCVRSRYLICMFALSYFLQLYFFMNINVCSWS